MAALKKGSKAAKDFMAKIRAAKGKTKPKKVAATKIGYKPDKMAIVKKATKKISSYKAKGYTRRDAIKLANKDAAFSVNGVSLEKTNIFKNDVLNQLDNLYKKITRYTEMKSSYGKMLKLKNLSIDDKKHYKYMYDTSCKHLLNFKTQITLLKKLI